MASKSHVSMMGWTMAANSEGGRYPWRYRKIILNVMKQFEF